MSSTGKHRLADPSWQQLELPVVDPTLCTSCGWCPAVCPTDCLAMDKQLPWLPRPLDCVSCGLCVLICPAGALHMEAQA